MAFDKQRGYPVSRLTIISALLMVLTTGAPDAQSINFICSTKDAHLGLQRRAPDQQTSGGFRQNAAGDLRCKWGKTELTVGFYGNDTFNQNRILSVAKAWEPFAHLTFRLAPVAVADIRIDFVPGAGFNSNIGSCTDSGRTMNYEDPRAPNHVILHEFGHALGLIHEHQSPAASIPWNTDAVYRYYERVVGWTRTMVNENIFARFNSTNFTQYDPTSIMHYPIDASLTDGRFEVRANTELSFLDKTFMNVWTSNGPWTNWQGREDEYLVGNWDNGSWTGNTGGPGDKLGVRRLQFVLMSFNFDGVHDFVQGYGNGRDEDQYLIGDWDGDGLSNVAVRKGNCVNMDFNFDGVHERRQCFGDGNAEDGYFVGDWDGDGDDNLAVLRANCLFMDLNFDGVHDVRQCFGNGSREDQYLVGDWDGNGTDSMAVRRGNCVYMDSGSGGAHEILQCYGNGASEDQYLVGDWNGDRRDNLAVRRRNCVYMDVDFNGSHDLQQCYGNGIP